MAEWLKATDCKSVQLTLYAGSNPALPTSFSRALHSGSASAFQADSAGSIPAARSITTFALSVGDISELRVMCDFVRAGYLVSVPFGEAGTLDYILGAGPYPSLIEVGTAAPLAVAASGQ